MLATDPAALESVMRERHARDFTLRELIGVFWSARGWIFAITIACTVVTLAAAWFAPRQYLSTALIMPIPRDSREGELGAPETLPQLSGLSALVGSPRINDAKAEAFATLQSDALAESYITAEHLLPLLYPRKWDVAKHAWKSADPRDVPTLWQAHEDFARVCHIAPDKKTGMVVIAVTWSDPVLAAKWANGLVDLANEHLRQQAIHTAESNIAYLERQEQASDNVEMKKAIYTLIQRELQSAMKAQGTREFAFKFIDPAIPPEKAYAPKVLFWAFGVFFAGFFLSLMVAAERAGLG